MKNLSRIVHVMAVGVLWLGVCGAQEPAVPAQAPQPNDQTQAPQPYGPLYAPPEAAAEKPIPDTRPLSGILGLTLGALKANENTVTASFRFGQVFDSNPAVLGKESDYRGTSSIGGNLMLHRAGTHQALDIAYNGGTFIYNDTGDLSSFHQLSLVQNFKLRRWTLTFTDSLNYSPEGGTGPGLGFNNFGTGAVPVNGVNSLLTPNQSIYTPFGRRLINTVGGQVQYGLSPRSSWTAGVTYGNAYNPDNDFGNTDQINLRTGYNRNWTAKDTISAFYDYGVYGSTTTHSAQLGYARRVTGRLSWAVNAGPQISQADSSDDVGVSWTASSSLQYQMNNTGANLQYSHGISQPVGAIGGTRTDTLGLGITHTIGRRWNIGVSGNLARNAQLVGTAEFRSGYAGVQVSRNLGPRTSAYANYSFQRQISDGNCVGAICNGLSRQAFGFGFSWGPRPWIIR